MPNIRVAVCNPGSLTRKAYLPAIQSLNVSVGMSLLGALTLTYPWDGHNADMLGQPCDLVLETESAGVYTEGPNQRFMYLADQRDPATRGPFQITAPCSATLLTKALVPPTSLDPDGRRTFTAQTIGVILGTLFTEAQARGAMSLNTWNFTNTLDSAGGAWDASHTLTISLDPGRDFLSILQEWADQGLIDWQINAGNQVAVYQLTRTTTYSQEVGNGTSARNMTGTVNLYLGRDLTEVPTTRSWENLMSHAVVAGDFGVVRTRTNGTTPWGRWETFVSAGGTDVAADLDKMGDNALADGSALKMSMTAGLTLKAGGPEPFVTYRAGDYVNVGTETATAGRVGANAPAGPLASFAATKLRVLQVNLSQDEKGNQSGSLVLADQFLPWEKVLLDRTGPTLRGTASVDATGIPPRPLRVQNTGLGASMVQTGNVVVATNGAGQAAFTFSKAYPAGVVPVVIANGGNSESVFVIPNPSNTGFVAQFYLPNGALIAGLNVRCYWVAIG